MLYILPYKATCNSMQNLTKALQAQNTPCKIITTGTTFTPEEEQQAWEEGSLFLRFGNPKPSIADNIFNFNTLNPLWTTAVAVNKLWTFQVWTAKALANLNILPYTTKRVDAIKWYEEGKTVVGRQTVTGFGGAGIHLYSKEAGTDLPAAAQLYTQYIKKKKEFRVHVFNGEVIDVQQKRRRNGVQANSQIRSWANGWVFAREGITVPDAVIQQALLAVQGLDLDFGAVDVIWNEKYQKAYALEVNTAPEIEGSTVQAYANVIKNLF